ncbi:hypothetical protein ILUMI_22668 [Ignelater luminosus]|uniref:Cilia- and flagella-associated protein 91 n=1 Tax=Ignelater luminosus TaxID=2038154 RepID=A0A8K0CGN3_IGNLU|nr:hypothetical protein ILUMI_22668 [Ignelater luminosus]
MSSVKVTTSRVNDYIYDPLFVVSGEKDYYKAAMIAKMSSAKFQICPIFPSMFSDLPHKPRHQFVMRKSAPIPNYKQRVKAQAEAVYDIGKSYVDVIGVDRHRFFYSPLARPDERTIPTITIPTPPPTLILKPIIKKKKNKEIQTQYRESSAQTIPWQPDSIVIDGSDPELLMLDFLKWGSGLPAGMHEVRLIERARMKRAWEKALPPITDEASLEKRRGMIAAIERDEWAFREQEIQDIHDLRMELLREMLNELLEKSKNRTEQKMKMFCEVKLAEKNEKIKKLRHQTERDLRKLRLKNRGINTRYHRINIIEEHADKKSELYGPLMRYGQHPKRWHQVIDEHIKKYRAQFLGVEEISTLPRWLDQATKVKDSTLKLPGTRLCFRETKWTTPVLKQLHEGLKNLRKEDKQHITLLERIEKEPSELQTPQVDSGDDWEEELHQASILIQSILRGRASQMLIFEGRDRCRELIQELRSTHALQEEDKIKKFNERLEVKSQQRETVTCLKNTTKLHETLNRLSGNVVGTLLDFLNKELRRLMDERRIHAMCLLFDRERHSREAAEAGRRQAELRRREEHDEMFKQVVKVHQDTVDLYLQDIVTEGMEFATEDEARTYIENLATKMDEQAYSTMDKLDFHDKEELVANLVHNFLLPETEKKIIREKIKNRQHNYLKTAHETIFNEIQNLPKSKLKSSKEKKIATKGKKHAAKPPRLEQAVCICGFDDLDLSETEQAPGEEDEVNTLFSSDDSETYVSEMSSIMGSLKYQTDSSSCKDVVPRLQLSSEFMYNIDDGEVQTDSHDFELSTEREDNIKHNTPESKK